VSENLFETIMENAELSKVDYADYKLLSFGEVTFKLMQAYPLSLVFTIAEQTLAKDFFKTGKTFKDFDGWKTIKSMPAKERADIAGLLALGFVSSYCRANYDQYECNEVTVAQTRPMEKKMITDLLRSKLPLSELHFLAFINSGLSTHNIDWGMAIAPILKNLDVYLSENHLSVLLQEQLIGFQSYFTEQADWSSSNKKFATQLDQIISEHS